uniref:hypothetical protein n=1 Tax=Micromonospora sp. NBC_00855 TaxID=2975978 RepID=UPI002257D51F|nr:hypothetical protein OHB51_35595 [Micromonospora sp. NBC_00855]
MTDVTVEVRAEQRFEDWRDGEVRTVPRTRRIETLIASGRLTVIETHDPQPATASPAPFGFSPSKDGDAVPESEPAVEGETPDRPPRQTRRQTKE